ncbi:MAG: hypothetical protein ACFFDW_14230 [Candidatus Thorarchaeota archaeon]
MYEEPKMEKITVNLPPVELGRIDLLVEAGIYPTRTEFIRSAIRKILDSHEEYIADRLEMLRKETTGIETKEEEAISSLFGMGVMNLGKKNFERALAQNKKIHVTFVGLLVIDKNVSAQLVEKTVEKVRVYGVIKASNEVRKSLEKINQK